MNKAIQKVAAGIIILIITALLASSGCTPPNQPPSISSLTIDKEQVETGASYQVECTASDPDGDELSYSWSADDGNISGEGSTVSWTAPEAPGSYTIIVAVSDDRDGEAIKQLGVDVVSVNHPPVIESFIVTAEHIYLAEITVGFSTSEIGYRVLEGKAYQIECVASDPDGDELTFEWSADAGAISGEGAVITWTAPTGAGERNVSLTVSDGEGGFVTESIVFVAVACGPCAFEPEDQ